MHRAMRVAAIAGATMSLGSAAGRPTYMYTGAPIPIPDGLNPATCATNCGADAVATINVPESFTVADLNVAWFIPHTWQADLQIYLRHGATTVLLVDRPGSDGTLCGFGNDNYGASSTSLFRSIATAANPYDTGSPGAPADNVVGDWRPENPVTPLIGLNSSGAWDLVVHDCAGQDTGQIVAVVLMLTGSAGCYANCDGSTVTPLLTINDFVCFQAKFAAGDSYANCDGSTGTPTLTINDFVCFQSQFAAGCSAP